MNKSPNVQLIFNKSTLEVRSIAMDFNCVTTWYIRPVLQFEHNVVGHHIVKDTDGESKTYREDERHPFRDPRWICLGDAYDPRVSDYCIAPMAWSN